MRRRTKMLLTGVTARRDGLAAANSILQPWPGRCVPLSKNELYLLLADSFKRKYLE